MKHFSRIISVYLFYVICMNSGDPVVSEPTERSTTTFTITTTVSSVMKPTVTPDIKNSTQPMIQTGKNITKKNVANENSTLDANNNNPQVTEVYIYDTESENASDYNRDNNSIPNYMDEETYYQYNLTTANETLENQTKGSISRDKDNSVMDRLFHYGSRSCIAVLGIIVVVAIGFTLTSTCDRLKRLSP